MVLVVSLPVSYVSLLRLADFFARVWLLGGLFSLAPARSLPHFAELFFNALFSFAVSDECFVDLLGVMVTLLVPIQVV
jgi:hypothetical protein